ncbi:MAG: beta-ketoacyl-[Alphaproteobacteria bacterium]|nr:beta-ketoacyl-[acyl-carrier-protein] synthase II [Alphaproteobacteria bacterium]
MEYVLKNLGFVCALGANHEDIVQNARKGDTRGMFSGNVVVGGEKVPFGTAPVEYVREARMYDLIDCALGQIAGDIELLKQNYALNRIGVIIGSSNTGVHEAQKLIEKAFQNNTDIDKAVIEDLELGMPAEYISQKTGVKGPVFTVSTACSSSLKVFSSARQLIENDICDAVLVGGVDGLCDFALNGFNALGALSKTHTNPMSRNRNGINLGEGAALFIMEKGCCGIKFLGIGESSDAYHLTSPDPTGAGAIDSMRRALKDANLQPKDIDFINMHGTGTAANDAMESLAINTVFGEDVLCASTKPLTGHTLGAAGAISMGLSWLMLKYDFIIPHVFDGDMADDCAKIHLANTAEHKEINRVLCNAFAFGGSNASLIMGK